MSSLWESISWTSTDGLTLRGRAYGSSENHAPVITCLPGLTRNSKDFHALALKLSALGYHVLCFDSRGRGESDYDPKWENYNLLTEADDIWSGLTALGIQKTTIIGTSRGGLLAMILAATHPTLLSSVALNDVGPQLGLTGLLRIKAQLNGKPDYQTWNDAIKALKTRAVLHFPALSDEDWQDFAQATYADNDGKPVSDFDPLILKPLEQLTNTTELPNMWAQFNALNHIPILVLRGALSDILSQETASRMCVTHPDCSLITIANQGHAPLFLKDEPCDAVIRFLQKQGL